jgi:hypothetical protein
MKALFNFLTALLGGHDGDTGTHDTYDDTFDDTYDGTVDTFDADADGTGTAGGEVEFGSGTAISGGSSVQTKTADELIIAADGTGYGSVSDYVGGTDPYKPLK